MTKIITIKEDPDCEVRVLEGYSVGSPAVRVEWGFSEGSENGPHSFCDSFAVAELGTLNEDGEFERIAWTEKDYGERIFSRSVIGRPKDCEG